MPPMQAQQQTSRQARAAMEVNRQVARPRIALILLLSSLAGAVAVRHHTRHTSGLTDNVAGLLSDGTTLTDLPYTGAPFLVISISSPEMICAHSVFLTMLIGDCLSPIPQVQRHALGLNRMRGPSPCIKGESLSACGCLAMCTYASQWKSVSCAALPNAAHAAQVQGT